MTKNQLLQKPLLLASFFFLSFFCDAQVTEEWVARYDGPANRSDAAKSLAVDGSGKVYVTGNSRGIGTSSDYATIKYKKTGRPQWVARYNGPGNSFDDATSLALDAAGNVYVTGGSIGTGTDYDYATIKYNKGGVRLWVARYNGPDNGEDFANSLAVDASGNVYVTGHSGNSTINFDYATIKYNKHGVQQWVARYNGPGKSYDEAFSLALDASGNVYVTGESIGIGSSSDYATIKYNAAGVEQWVARYNGPANLFDGAVSLAVDDLGKNVFVTGYSNGIGTSLDYATIKYNTVAGVLQWVARYDGPDNDVDRASSLAVDISGNVYVTGGSLGKGTESDYDYATIKYNEVGVEQWVARYNSAVIPISSDRAFSLALDASRNVYVTGTIGNGGTGISPEIGTIKYDAAGALQWLARYNGPGIPAGDRSDDQGNSVVVDVSGNVYVTGLSDGVGTTSYDYVTIKYSQPPPIAARPVPSILSQDMPSGLQVSNYPNPVSTTTRIEYELPYDGQVAIKVYDVLGREVATLVNAGMKTGFHSTDFNASSLQNGLYYYRVTVNTEKKVFIQSKKIIVVK